MISIQSMGQESIFKLGFGVGKAPYELAIGLNIEGQYEYQATKFISAYLALGTILSLPRESYFTSGTDQLGSYSNNIVTRMQERFHYLDVGLMPILGKVKDHFTLKGKIGYNLGRSVYTYPESMIIRRGQIESQVDVTQKVFVHMLSLGCENVFHFDEKVSLHWNINAMINFGDRYKRTRSTSSAFTSGSTITELLFVFTSSLHVGYRF